MTATLTLRAPLEGWCMPLAATPDPVFSAGMMGDGIALDPTCGELVAPFAGEVVAVPASGHAVSLRSTAGIEVLIHVGIDTVALGGRGFTPHVVAGQTVAVGELLLSVDLDLVARNAPSLVTPIVITNLAGHTIQFRHEPGAVRPGEVLLTLTADGASANSALAVAAGGERREARLSIALAHGLHARPAALIAQSLKGLAAEVELVAGVRRANARSVVSIMALGLRQGDELRVVALGREAEAALAGAPRLIPFGTKIELHGADFLRDRKIQGTSMGGNRFRVDMPRLLELWRQGRLKLDTLISGKIKLEQINEGFEMLKSGAPVRNLIDFGVV